jgi:hypothetical protein
VVGCNTKIMDDNKAVIAIGGCGSPSKEFIT